MSKEYQINIENRVGQLWHFLQYALDDIPRCYPPPVEIHRSSKEEFDRIRNRNPGEVTDFLCAQMYTKHTATPFGVEPTRYKMIVNIDWFNLYLQYCWGKQTSKIASKILVDHILIHEMIHYCRNVEAYLTISGDKEDDIDYPKHLENYKEYWRNAGRDTDEHATETLTMEVLEEIYNVRSDLKPVWTGRFAQYKELRQPGYIDRLSVMNFIDMDNIIYSMRKNDAPESKIQDAVKFCRKVIVYHSLDTRTDLVIPKLVSNY